MLVGATPVAMSGWIRHRDWRRSYIPIVMGISREQGFLFSSSVIAVGLVMLVALLALSVLLWNFGISPQYTY